MLLLPSKRYNAFKVSIMIPATAHNKRYRDERKTAKPHNYHPIEL